jgi:hypothetical protein
MSIKQKLLVPFAIANNLLAPSTKATNLRISPHAIIAIAWINSKNPKGGPMV